MERLSFIKKKKTKFILSLLSAIFYLLGQGVIVGASGLSVYILSYIHHKDEWVDMQYGNLMMPFMTFCLSLFSPISGPLEKMCGPLISLFISFIIIETCLLLFYIQRNIWVFYSITLLAGFGAGISSQIPIKNACFYYPNQKGLISSVIMSFVGVSAALYIFIGENIVNPEKEGVIDQETDPYYSEEVSQRSKNYFLFAMIVLPIFTFLSFLFFYKYNPNCETEEPEENEDKEEKNENNCENEEELKDNFIKKDKKQKKLNSFYKPSPSKNIKIALKSFRFWRNIIISGVMPFWLFFIQSSFRPYVVMIGVDTNIIYFLGSGIALISCFLGPVWATLVDKFGFQPIIMIIGIISTGMPIYFFFFLDNQIFYVIGLIISTSILVGIMASVTPHLMQIYGLRYFLTIGGFARLFNDLNSFIAAITTIVLSIYFKNAKELLFPYKMVVVGGFFLSATGLIMIFFENDEKFIYGDENEEEKYYVKEGENGQNDTFEKEKEYINENASTILDVSNSKVNNNESKNEESKLDQ